jgi:hypothetical protein
LILKSVGWVFYKKGGYCCGRFGTRTEDREYPHMTIFTDGTQVFFDGHVIDFCPFCGKKIEIERRLD